MANILLMPLSGNIYFDHGAHQASTVPDLIHCGVSLGYDGCAGVTVTSNNTAVSATDRFTVAGSSGSLFSVNDTLTGTVFSVNDASGLPIIEVNSDATTDTIAIGEYGTNALFVSAGNVGVGTATPTSSLDVAGNIAVTGTVDGRDLAADGTKLNSICCGATTCTGTTTPSNTQTFTNKSGNISQWTNNSGYTTCTGDITGVTAGSGLCGGGTSGTVTLNVGAGTAITVAADTVGVNSTCNSTWNAKTTCTGTTTPSNTQTFTNKSGNISQWTNDSGYTTCTGDITNVSAGTLLDGGGGSGSVTLNVDLSELTDMTEAWATASDEFVVLDSGSQKRKLSCEIFGCNAFNSTGFTTCTGDITSVTAGSGLTGGASSGGATLNVGAGTAITVAADTVGVNSTCNSTWNAKTTCTGTTTPSNTQTFTNKSGNISQWTNNSGYTTCTGTTTPSNTQTFTNKTGNISQWTNNSGYTTCTGDITNVSAGDGLNGGGSSGGVTVCVDSTVARTNVDETFNCDLTVNGDLTVTGDLVCLETIVSTTSALSVTNHGSGPGLFVCQAGSNAVVNFVDAEVGSIFYVENGGNVGIRDTNPAHALDVTGNINATGSFKLDNYDVINSGKCFIGAQVRPTTDIADAYIASAATWNAKTTCTGTTTPSNTQTFTNKSGSNNQWTNDAGYTTCTGTTTPSNTQTFTNKCGSNNQWVNDAGYTTCTGDITGVTAGTLLDGGGTSGSVTLNVDLSELTDGTAAIVPASDEIVYLDAGSQKRKLFSEIFGSNAYNSTTIPTNNNQLTNGSGYTGCTGTTTPSNTQTFTNKSGNISQWTNDSGYTTCTGTGVGNITCVTTSTGLDGAGSSGTVTVSLDLSELTDMTGDVNPLYDELILLDSGAERRKRFSEIFGCNAYSNTAFTTCTGDITGVTAGAGLSGGATSGTATVALDGAMVATLNQSGCSGLNCVGDITGVSVGTGLAGGGTSGSVSVCVDSTCNSAWNAKTTCTGTTTPSNTQTFTNKSGNISQWTNDSGYTGCTGTTTPSNTQTFTNKSGNISQWTNNSGYTTCTGDITAVVAGTDLTGGATSGSATLNVTSATASTGSTIVKRDSSGDINVRLLRSEYDSTNASIGFIMTQVDTASNNYVRPSTMAQVRSSLNVADGATNVTNTNQLTNGAGYTTCTGDITGVTASTGLAGGGTSGSVTLCINSTCNSTWNAKTTCTGTTTPSNTQTFTNKSGNISQWTNNSGYTTCTGDITGVTAGNGLSGGATSGTATVGLDATTAASLNQAGCAGINCTGDITNVGVSTGLAGGGSSGSVTLCINSTCNSAWNAKTTCTGTTTPSNTQTFTNKSGSNNQWTNDAGYTTCTGDITGVTAGTLLDGGGSSGSVTLNVDLSELTDGTAAVVPTTDEIVYLDAGSQKRKLFSEIFGSNAYNSTAFTTCTGDITSVTAGSGLTGGASSGGATLNVGAGTAITVAADTVGVNSTCNSTWNAKTTCTGTTTPSNTQTFTNKSGNISQWTNNSGYTTCTGDITGVTAGAGLSGGATSGTATLALDGSCLAGLNQSACPGINCVGDITGVSVSTGLAGGGTSGSVTLCINSTCNSTWNAKTTCTGTTTPSNTQTFTNKSGNISQWTNNSGYTACAGIVTGLTAGTGLDIAGSAAVPAVNLDLSELTDGTAAIVPTSDEIVYLDAGSQKRKLFSEIFGSNAYNSTTIPTDNIQLANSAGYTSCTGDITAVTAGSGLTGGATSGGATLNVGAGTAITVAADTVGVNSTCNSTWNAKTTCTGTTTPSNTQTFTNKSGNISQWTNDSGYTAGATTCTGNLCGDFAMKVLTTGGSVCLGKCAGKSITEGTGQGNVFLGACTGCTTTTGDANLAFGKQALQQNSTGSRNVAIGDVAGFRITGSDNLVFGRSAGCGITSANCSIAIGNYAMRTTTNNSIGSSNIGIGTFAMLKTISGSCNTAIGFCALQNNNTGSKNVAIGPCSMGAGSTAITGNCNIAIGEATAWKNTSGSNNIAMGFVALGCNCTGSCNVAIGYTAGRFTGTGTSQMQAPTKSIFIGCDATGGGGSSTTNETVIGSGAVGCGSNKIMLGNSSVTSVCSNGTFSTVSDRRDKTCICDLEFGLDFIGNLKPKTFNMITDRSDPEGSISCKRHGFIAQDVIALEGDDPVITNNDNPDRLGYTGEHIIPILVKGMQQQQAIIKNLTARLEALEG